MERIISFIPQKPVMLFDIFINDRFYCQVSFKCLPGFEYKYMELKKQVVKKKTFPAK